MYLKFGPFHFMKSVRIWSYSGSYSVRMPENTDENNSESELQCKSSAFHPHKVFQISTRNSLGVSSKR